MDEKRPLQVLSLGAGVQSSTLLLMACRGEFPLDAAIFADTQWEPPAVYEQVDRLELAAAEAGIIFRRVTAGNIRNDALAAGRGEDSPTGNRSRFASMPLYVRDPHGTTGRIDGRLRRQCTKEYKIEPVRRELRALLREVRGVAYPRPGAATLVMGISLDEATRMKPSQVAYIVHDYPLVERRLKRSDCLAWLQEHGYARPPKSACIGCPYHNDSLWAEMRRERPTEFADAVEVDVAIRSLPRIDGETFLHRSCVPLALANFNDATDNGQLDLFAEECEGMCGT